MYLEYKCTEKDKKSRKTREKIEKRFSDGKMADTTSENQNKHPTEDKDIIQKVCHMAEELELKKRKILG